MLVLDATTKSLEIKLAGAITTSQLPFVASYVDINQSSIAITASSEADGTTNNTTAVTVAAAPGATTTRKLNFLSVVNIDTVQATLTVQVNNNSTLRICWRGLLAVGDTLQFVDGKGFTVTDSNGSVKQSGSTGATGAAGTAGATGIGVPGSDGDDGTDWIIPGPPGAAGAAGAGGGNYTLLKANSGTDTSAGAANVDTFALASGLTAKDTLLIFYTLESVTQATAAPQLYNSTDSLLIAYAQRSANQDMAAGGFAQGVFTVRQRQAGVTKVLGQATNYNSATGSIVGDGNQLTFTTNWTGAWTVALRHAGVVSGGTFQWSWALYKVTGQ